MYFIGVNARKMREIKVAGRSNFPWKKSICDTERVWRVCRILGISRRKIRSRRDWSLGSVGEGDQGRIGRRAGREGMAKDS